MKKISEYIIKARHYEVIIASSLVLLTVLVLSLKFLLPNFKKAQEIFQEQNKIRNRLTSLKKKSTVLASVDSSYYKGTLNKLNQILPLTKNFVSLFSTLDSLQTKTGVIVLATQFQASSLATSSPTLSKNKINQAESIPIKLEVLGEINQFENFLDNLTELSGRLITIDKVEWISRIDGLIHGDITAQAYFYPLPETLEKIGDPLPEFDNLDTQILNKVAISQPIFTLEEETEKNIGKKDLFN